MGLLFFIIALVVLVWLLGRTGAPPAGFVERTIEISAPAPAVWNLLLDGENFIDWHPTIPGYQLIGGQKVGAAVQLDIPGDPGPILKLVRSHVSVFEPGRKMVWHSRLGWLANFIHEFEVVALDEARSRFVQREAFTGIFCWLWAAVGGLNRSKSIDAIVGQGHDDMNKAMKQKLESDHGNSNDA